MQSKQKKKYKKYEYKLEKNLEINQNFLIDNLKTEWEESLKIINKKERAEKNIEMAKKSGIALGKIIISLALIGGILTVATVAPNVFSAFGKIINTNKKYKTFFNKKEFEKTTKYLKRYKYIKIVKKKGDGDEEIYEIYLEKKGAQRVIKEGFNNLTIAKPEKWDGIWRMVMFDIPNKHKWAREGFREKLRQMNFYQVQESVFVYPYNCFKEIEFLCSVFNIVDCVRYAEIKKIFFDNDILDFYQISK